MEFEAMMSRCIYGEGACQKIAAVAKELRCSKALCIYDKGVWNAGLVEPVLKMLEEAGIPCAAFDGVMPDPTVALVDQAASLAKEEGVDLIVAIGGGSAIDTAKAVNLLMNNPGSIGDYFGLHHDANPGVTLIVVPTTAGTGSEMTAVSILTDTVNQRKVFAKSWKMLPTVAILDPTLMLGLPRAITAYTGIDALAHACEGYTCIKANPFTDAMCLSAVKLIFSNLRQAVEDGKNLEARGNMAIAATQAGIGFGYSTVHVGHGLAHAMGAVWHIPHGLGCALALPYALRHVGPSCDVDRLRQLGQAMEVSVPQEMTAAEATDIIVSRIRLLCSQVGIPTLPQLGIEKNELEHIVAASMKESLLISNSGVPFTEEMCRNFYLELFEKD